MLRIHEIHTRIIKATPWTNHLDNYAERLKTIVYFHTGLEGEQTSGDQAGHVVFTETKCNEPICGLSMLMKACVVFLLSSRALEQGGALSEVPFFLRKILFYLFIFYLFSFSCLSQFLLPPHSHSLHLSPPYTHPLLREGLDFAKSPSCPLVLPLAPD